MPETEKQRQNPQGGGRAARSPLSRPVSSPTTRQAAAAERSEAVHQRPKNPAPPTVPEAAALIKQMEDCGTCVNCLDKRKFGGPGLKRKACVAKRQAASKAAAASKKAAAAAAAASQSKSVAVPLHSPRSRSLAIGAACIDSIAGPSSLGFSSFSPCLNSMDSPAYELRVSDMLSFTPLDRSVGGPDFMKTPIGGLGLSSPLPSAGKRKLSPAEAAAIAVPRRMLRSAEGHGSLGPIDAIAFKTGGATGQGLAGEESEGRAPLNELPVNHSMSKTLTPAAIAPSTPMKTPEIEALLNAAAGGASPLSEFAHLLDSEQRLPSNAAGGGSMPEMSPLFQLANLTEYTPRLPMPRLNMNSAERPADPDELKHALLNSSLGTSPLATNTPDQLCNDLRAALQPSGFGSVEQRSIDQLNMPPPDARMSPGLSAQEKKAARKRNLEEALVSGGVAESMMAGMFDPIDGSGLDLCDASDRFSLCELIDQPLDQLEPASRRKSSGGSKRSKRQEKEKGKPAKCRCDKSGCLKRYCVCFAVGNVCSPECACKGCVNNESTEEFKRQREEAIKLMEKKKSNAFKPRIGVIGDGEEGAFDQVHLVGCNCKKSGCIKRYCECYQAGVKCSDKCKCCDCKNPHGAFEGCRRSESADTELLSSSASNSFALAIFAGTAPLSVSTRSPSRSSPKSPRAPSSPADTLIAAAELADKAEEMDIDYLRVDSCDRLSERGGSDTEPVPLLSAKRGSPLFARPRDLSPAAGTPAGDTAASAAAGADTPATGADKSVAAQTPAAADTPATASTPAVAETPGAAAQPGAETPAASTSATVPGVPTPFQGLAFTPAGKPQPKLQAPSSEALGSVGPTTSFGEIARPTQPLGDVQQMVM